MTIVEIERVSAPPKEREDAREERARVLEAAALEIEVRGWTTGTAENCRGNVCAIGALKAALGFEPNAYFSGGILVAVNSSYGDEGDWSNLPSFNDEVAGSADEVTFLLRWRAEEIRDGR